MTKIALVGESPYDTSALKNLLLEKYNDGIQYAILLKNITGDQLNTRKAKRAFIDEVKLKQPDFIVIMRDADALETDNQNINEKIKWYSDFSDHVRKKSIFLLNIYELEALIFADIEKFNTCYNTEIKSNRKVTYIEKPKEELMRHTAKQGRQYAESHCPELFKLLRIDVISKNCVYFRDFLKEFSRLLGEQNN